LGKYGLPRLPEDQRREAGALHIRLTRDERRVVEEKASQAGVTPHTWAYHAVMERDPPRRQIIPELNREAWLELARLATTVNSAVWRFRPGGEEALRDAVERLRGELAEVRNLLIEGSE
jgi:hypothetical protein